VIGRIAVWLLLASVPIARAEPATVEQPRPFGYVLGDTLAQRILLVSAGHDFEPASLPPIERAGLWFARRSTRVAAEHGRRWLVIDYQLVNAPQALMSVNLPAVTLKAKSGPDLTVAEWPVSIGPLTPRAVFAKGELRELRPDHAPPLLPTLALRRQFEFWAAALALLLLSWLGWWALRSLRASANQPFAQALREIRRSGDEGEPAWVALHRAFDRTAGQSVQLGTLPLLFQHAPQLEPQRAAIEGFFAASSRRFFGSGDGGSDSHAAGSSSLRALCATLRAIEKRYER
jgi:mxaA protein